MLEARGRPVHGTHSEADCSHDCLLQAASTKPMDTSASMATSCMLPSEGKRCATMGTTSGADFEAAAAGAASAAARAAPCCCESASVRAAKLLTSTSPVPGRCALSDCLLISAVKSRLLLCALIRAVSTVCSC